MILKKSDLDFNKFKKDLAAKCPTNAHESFVQGYQYILSQFFDDLDGCILAHLVDVGVYDFDLGLHIECIMDYLPFKTKELKVHQLPKFLEGVQLGLLESSRLLELVSLKSENSAAA